MVVHKIKPVKAITVDALVDKCYAAYVVPVDVATNAIIRRISTEDDDEDVRDDDDDNIDKVNK